jgi:hypothetical protein
VLDASVPSLGGGGGRVRSGEGCGVFVFFRVEPKGEIFGGRMGTCKHKTWSLSGTYIKQSKDNCKVISNRLK